MNHFYGWKKQKDDGRDFIYFPHPKHIKARPPAYDMTPQFFPCYNQGDLGSCTANGISAAVEWDDQQEYKQLWTPSRLFIYYNERDMEGSVGQDSGAEIRDGIKTINSQGVCDEAIWPYDISQFTVKPPDNCYSQAKLHESLKYEAVDQTAEAIETALSQNFPIVFGVSVYQSFEDATDGNIPMPNVGLIHFGRFHFGGEQLLGGHCIVLTGYDSVKQLFAFRNSWGTSWGQNGYGTLPYQYVLNSSLSSDFWIITLME